MLIKGALITFEEGATLVDMNGGAVSKMYSEVTGELFPFFLPTFNLICFIPCPDPSDLIGVTGWSERAPIGRIGTLELFSQPFSFMTTSCLTWEVRVPSFLLIFIFNPFLLLPLLEEFFTELEEEEDIVSFTFSSFDTLDTLTRGSFTGKGC